MDADSSADDCGGSALCDDYVIWTDDRQDYHRGKDVQIDGNAADVYTATRAHYREDWRDGESGSGPDGHLDPLCFAGAMGRRLDRGYPEPELCEWHDGSAETATAKWRAVSTVSGRRDPVSFGTLSWLLAV